jgi:hypothetical protein
MVTLRGTFLQNAGRGEAKTVSCLIEAGSRRVGRGHALRGGLEWKGEGQCGQQDISPAVNESEVLRRGEAGEGAEGENALALAGTRWRRSTTAMRQPPGEMTRPQSEKAR